MNAHCAGLPIMWLAFSVRRKPNLPLCPFLQARLFVHVLSRNRCFSCRYKPNTTHTTRHRHYRTWIGASTSIETIISELLPPGLPPDSFRRHHRRNRGTAELPPGLPPRLHPEWPPESAAVTWSPAGRARPKNTSSTSPSGKNSLY